MRITKSQLRKIVQEARWEDRPDPYGGAEGDLDMGHIHDVDDLFDFLRNDIAKLMDEAFDMGRTMGLDPASIREVFKDSCAYVVDLYFPENRR